VFVKVPEITAYGPVDPKSGAVCAKADALIESAVRNKTKSWVKDMDERA